jgi:hypothetical protein
MVYMGDFLLPDIGYAVRCPTGCGSPTEMQSPRIPVSEKEDSGPGDGHNW